MGSFVKNRPYFGENTPKNLKMACDIMEYILKKGGLFYAKTLV